MNYYPFYNQGAMQQPQNLSRMVPVQPMQRPIIPAQEERMPVGGFKFSVYKDEERPHRPTDLVVEDDGTPVEQKRRRGRPRKSESQVVASTGIITAQGENEDTPTIYSYQETTNMLHATLMQVEMTTKEVQRDIELVRANKTIRNKYGIIGNLNGNMTDLINAKITCIKELNSTISKANDLDYKKEKDRQAAQSNINDDKYIMDMYNAFLQNPTGAGNSVLGPNAIDATTIGSSGIIRAGDTVQQGTFAPDNGFLSYVANMTPEQRLMAMEDNPNIKQVVVYDAATSNKAFQVMDMSTGQVITGVPTRDPMFMEGVTIDLRNRIAKNSDLGETYPLVIVNENVVTEY